MIRVDRQSDFTALALGSSYDSLDETALDELAGALLTEALTAEPPRILLDLSSTDFIGSRFIELLVRAWKRLSEREGAMVLCGVRPFCAEVIRVTRLDTLWESYATRDQAVAALKQAQG